MLDHSLTPDPHVTYGSAIDYMLEGFTPGPVEYSGEITIDYVDPDFRAAVLAKPQRQWCTYTQGDLTYQGYLDDITPTENGFTGQMDVRKVTNMDGEVIYELTPENCEHDLSEVTALGDTYEQFVCLRCGQQTQGDSLAELLAQHEADEEARHERMGRTAGPNGEAFRADWPDTPTSPPDA
ncbi:MAG TPA: hypothetical protein VGK17_03150 [Propionicimonas sp.]